MHNLKIPRISKGIHYYSSHLKEVDQHFQHPALRGTAIVKYPSVCFQCLQDVRCVGQYQRVNIAAFAENALVNDRLDYCNSRSELCFFRSIRSMCSRKPKRGHSGRVVTLSPPTTEAGVRFPARPQVGKLVVACRWPAVYSTEP